MPKAGSDAWSTMHRAAISTATLTAWPGATTAAAVPVAAAAGAVAAVGKWRRYRATSAGFSSTPARLTPAPASLAFISATGGTGACAGFPAAPAAPAPAPALAHRTTPSAATAAASARPAISDALIAARPRSRRAMRAAPR